jgi:5'-3' exonuclease
MKKAKDHCDLHNYNYDVITRLVDAEPLSHILHNVNSMIKTILEQTGANEYQLFLGGENNFRHDIATLKIYKGNRDPNHKPFFYHELREYLVNTWGAEVIDGMEADDMLGICQELDTIIVTTDKDLDMIPGTHYNWKKKRSYWVTEEEGIYNFYKQLLTGDTTDNIIGVPGIGDIKSERILKPFRDEEDYFWDVLEEYNKKYAFPMEALIENARLLWILRNDGQIWEPPA